MRINRAGGGKTVIAPDFLKQAISAQSFPLVAKEVLQQLELLRREIQWFAAARDLATAQIYLHIAKCDAFLFFWDSACAP